MCKSSLKEKLSKEKSRCLYYDGENEDDTLRLIERANIFSCIFCAALIAENSQLSKNRKLLFRSERVLPHSQIKRIIIKRENRKCLRMKIFS